MGTTLYDVDNYFPHSYDTDSDLEDDYYYQDDSDISDEEHEYSSPPIPGESVVLQFLDKEYLSFPEVTTVIFTSEQRKFTNSLLIKLMYLSVGPNVRCEFHPNHGQMEKIPEMYNNIGKNGGVLLVIEVEASSHWNNIKSVVDILPNVKEIIAIIGIREVRSSKLSPETVNIPDLHMYVQSGDPEYLQHIDIKRGMYSVWFSDWDVKRNTSLKKVLGILEKKSLGKSPEYIYGLYNTAAERIGTCQNSFADKIGRHYDYHGGILYFQKEIVQKENVLTSPDPVENELLREFNVGDSIQTARDIYNFSVVLSIIGSYKAKKVDPTKPFYIFTCDFLKSKSFINNFFEHLLE